VASLIDTNVLVYRVDARFPEKQRIARDVLNAGLEPDRLALPHQAILEFVSVVTRPRRDLQGDSLLSTSEALQEADVLMRQFPVLYPDAEVLTTAIRGAATYRLPWFDAHLWAYAEVNGLPEILSEDFSHGQHYGSVRVRNPFLAATGAVHELPPMYDP
jgi:predicted nucleic acid-binding protein